jgi:hypothetical protein
MLRVSIDERPLAWREVSVPVDGESASVRIRYHTWTPAELLSQRRERLELARAVRGGEESAALDALLERLTPERVADMREQLLRRIVAWELADESGAPLAVSPATVGAVLDLPGWLAALWEGLFEASDGAPAKNG